MRQLKYSGLLILLFIFRVVHAQESDLDQWLELDLSELMNIKVSTATKKEQLIEKVPATVRIITASQIQERAYHSLEDVLQDLPGFQFRNIQGFNSYSFQRGAPSQNNLILVLVDGIQINELSSGGFYGGYQYNLQNVKQIEVVYGPSSALYGTNAISGIINIITKDAENQPQASASVAGGSFGTLLANCSYKVNPANSPFSTLLAAQYNQTEKADLGGAEGDWDWSEKMENFEKDFSFDSKISYKNTKFGLTLQDKQASRTTNYKSIGTGYLDSGTNWHIRFINAYLRNLYDQKTDWSLKSRLYYRNATVVDNTIAYIDTTQGVGQVGYYRPTVLAGLEEQFDYQFTEKANLTAGMVLEAEKLASDFSKSYSGDPDKKPPKPGEPDYEHNTLISLYAQSQYKFFQTTEITAGGRLDHSSYYGNVFTPRLGVVYNQNNYTAKLLYTEAFRAPKPWDYHWGSGNPNLDPERMRSIELANLITPTKYLRLELCLYKNQIYDILTQDTCWVNADQLNTNGLELNLDYSRNKIQLYLNYTYTDSKYSDGSVVPEIARHSLNTGIGYSIWQNLKVHLRGNYLSRRKNPVLITTTNSHYVNAYLVWNSVINYMPTPKMEIQMAVNNLLGAVYYHTSNRPPERYRQPQHTILLKFSYQI
jgi:outer membrane cobalamin receptor